MFTEELKVDGVVKRRTVFTQDNAPATIVLPPRPRLDAAAVKTKELMDKEGLTLAAAMEDERTLDAARNAPLDGSSAPASGGDPAPGADDPAEITDEEVEAVRRRHLLSCLNQGLTSFNHLTTEEMRDLLVQPRFENVPCLTFEEFCKRRG